MTNRDTVEYYNADAPQGRDLVAAVASSIVPPVGSLVNIRGRSWRVAGVCYAIDYADRPGEVKTRANVELREELSAEQKEVT